METDDCYIRAKLEEFDRILNSTEDCGSELERKIHALEVQNATLEERIKSLQQQTQYHWRLIYFLLTAAGGVAYAS